MVKWMEEELTLSAICLRAAVPDLLSEFSVIHSGSNSPALACIVRQKKCLLLRGLEEPPWPSDHTLTARAPGAGRGMPEGTTARESCTSASYLIWQCAIAGFIEGCRQVCLRDIGSVAPRVSISDRDKPLLLMQDFCIFWVHGQVHKANLSVSWLLYRVIPYPAAWFSSLLVRRCLTPCSEIMCREFRNITQDHDF